MAGRKPKLIRDERTLTAISAGARMMHTISEIAATLGVRRQSLQTFMDKWPVALDAFEIARASGKAGIRTAQMRAALKGNPTMLIWLGKQELDQKDVARVEQTGKNGAPIATVAMQYDFSKLSLAELEQLESLYSKAIPLSVAEGGNSAPEAGRAEAEPGAQPRIDPRTLQ